MLTSCSSGKVTFVQVNIEDLLLSNDLPAVAGEAAIQRPHPFPMALALGAHGLDVVDHVWPQLVNNDLHARAVTLGTSEVKPFPSATA